MKIIVSPWMTATRDVGTPTARCIASAPVSRNPKNNPAGRTVIGLRAPSSAIATALNPKPCEKPSIRR